MNLSKKIAAALDENTKVHLPPCDIAVEEGAHRLTLHLTAIDTVGLAFDSLEFVATDRTDWTPDSLRSWGDRLAARVTYLMEPFKILEIDAEDGKVCLRSESPTTRNQKRSYYEIRLGKSGTLRMERHTFDEAARVRDRSTCQLTREVLERLADDIVASLP